MMLDTVAGMICPARRLDTSDLQSTRQSYVHLIKEDTCLAYCRLSLTPPGNHFHIHPRSLAYWKYYTALSTPEVSEKCLPEPAD
jgi:hypothetical protein